MDDYLKQFREMISLRGLTDHTIVSYSTYIRSYLDYLSNILHKLPEDVSWAELRDFIRWLQKEKNLSDRTLNACISQLRFFTMYVLHKPWDPTQLPLRKFDAYLPYVPSQEEAFQFISTMPDIKPKAMCALMYSSGLRIGEVCRLRYEDIDRKNMRIHISHTKAGRTAMPLCPGMPWICLHSIGFNAADLQNGFFQAPRNVSLTNRSIPIISPGISINMRNGLGGRKGSPVTPSGTPSEHICMRMESICLPSRRF